MSKEEQRRSWVISRLMAGELGTSEAAHALGLSERSIRRLRARVERDGPAGLVHGNRGRTPSNRLSMEAAARIVKLAEETYAHVNDSHLAELLAEREGITVSRAAVRRLLRAAGRSAPRRRRPPRHRSRRERRPREGLLLQTDGSRSSGSSMTPRGA